MQRRGELRKKEKNERKKIGIIHLPICIKFLEQFKEIQCKDQNLMMNSTVNPPGPQTFYLLKNHGYMKMKCFPDAIGQDYNTLALSLSPHPLRNSNQSSKQ